VTDTGPGVPTDRLDGLFDRFTRTDDARTAGGAGLGLSIVAAVATAHHGRVRARNRPQGGLEVTMTLGAGRGPDPHVVGSGRNGDTSYRV
jgi:signal transduction histidine kinase